MNVKELIEVLGEYPADMRVVVQGYEDGYDDLSPEQLSRVKIVLDAGKERWEGKHGATGIRPPEDVKVADALVLRRVSW